MGRQVSLFDTTLRDGAQTEGVSFSTEDKLEILQRLDAFGMDFVEGGYPGSNPKDKAFFKAAEQADLRHTKLVAFGSTRKAGVPAKDDVTMRSLLEANTEWVSIFGKAWDLHAIKALGVSLEENLEIVSDTVGFLTGSGKRVIFDAEHFFDGWKDNPEYAMKVLAGGQGRRRGMAGAMRHERRHVPVQGDRGGQPGPREVRHTPGHPRAQRLRDGSGELHGGGAGRGHHGPGHDQWTGRAVRQCQSVLGRPQPHFEDEGRNERDQAVKLDRFVRIRGRDGEHIAGPATSVRGGERLRPQGRHARFRDSQGEQDLRAHRSGIGRQRTPHPDLRTFRNLVHPGQGQGAGHRDREGRRDDRYWRR